MEKSEQLKKDIEAKQTEQKLKAKAALEHLIRCVNAVAATEEGRYLLRHLAYICGFGKTKVVGDIQSKTVDPVSTTFNAAMENVYLQIRRMIRREHLIKIELTKQEE